MKHTIVDFRINETRHSGRGASANTAMSPLFICVLFISLLVSVTLIGCGSDTKGPDPKGPDPKIQDDLMLMEKIVGVWDVISVNDIAPSRFLTVLVAKAVEIPDDGIQEDIGVPAAPDRFNVVDIIEDEINEVYFAKVDIDDFHYTFNMDEQWTLRVQFDILHDAVPPDEGAVDPGSAVDPGGEGQDPPSDLNKQAPPAANGTHEVIAVVVGTWSGTYSVMRDLLSFTVDVEDVKVTLHPSAKAFFEELTDGTEADTQEERARKFEEALTRKFRSGLINPFSKTFISVEDTLTFKVPGSSSSKMILEKQEDDL